MRKIIQQEIYLRQGNSVYGHNYVYAYVTQRRLDSFRVVNNNNIELPQIVAKFFNFLHKLNMLWADLQYMVE